MRNNRNSVIIIILLAAAMVLSFIFPREKYVGTKFLSSVNIPSSLPEWTGANITSDLSVNNSDDKYNFISETIAYQYVNTEGKKLIFIILDAANFHHPKVCFTNSGFKTKDLPDEIFHVSDRLVKAHSLLTEKGSDTFLSFYWICIDKRITHQWIEQKIKQIFFSLFNKKRVGLMVRIDIPLKEIHLEDSENLAQKFVSELFASMPPEQTDYIFGNH
jgi:EpsI family protein